MRRIFTLIATVAIAAFLVGSANAAYIATNKPADWPQDTAPVVPTLGFTLDFSDPGLTWQGLQGTLPPEVVLKGIAIDLTGTNQSIFQPQGDSEGVYLSIFSGDFSAANFVGSSNNNFTHPYREGILFGDLVLSSNQTYNFFYTEWTDANGDGIKQFEELAQIELSTDAMMGDKLLSSGIIGADGNLIAGFDQSFEIAVGAIPEPGTATLSLLGLSALLLRRRRKAA